MSESAFREVTNKEEIRRVLDFHMHNPEGGTLQGYGKTHAFVPGIVVGKLIHEGARPISAVTDGDGHKTYYLANSDTAYRRAYAVIKLEEIDKIQLLRG